MKNFRQDDDSLRSEYKRSDFGEMVRGKYSRRQVKTAEVVGVLLACIGEDEGLQFIHHLPTARTSRKSGDWTYELDEADQITLRYWLSKCGNLEERISLAPSIITAQDSSDLQELLLNHVHALRGRVQP